MGTGRPLRLSGTHEFATASSADDEQYVYRGEVFMATAVKADHPAGNH